MSVSHHQQQNFSRYASAQTANGSSNNNDPQLKMTHPPRTTTSGSARGGGDEYLPQGPPAIPSLMSLVTPTFQPSSSSPPVATPVVATRKLSPSSISSSPTTLIKDRAETFSFPYQPTPGPIKRPDKLATATSKPLMVPTSSSFLQQDLTSPSTPDVLDQINRLLDHQESITSPAPALPTPSSTLGHWTPFAPSVWQPSKDDHLSFSVVSPLATTTNPFAKGVGEASWQKAAASGRTQRSATWNDFFSSSATAEGGRTKTTPVIGTISEKENTNWLWQDGKAIPVRQHRDSSSESGNETKTTNDFWDSLMPVVPSSSESASSSQQENWNWTLSQLGCIAPPSIAATSSDENNNNNSEETPEGEEGKLKSRWDFAH